MTVEKPLDGLMLSLWDGLTGSDRHKKNEEKLDRQEKIKMRLHSVESGAQLVRLG